MKMKLFKIKNFLAFLIDWFLCLTISYGIGEIIKIIFNLNSSNDLYLIVMAFSLVILFVKKDLLFKNQSIANKIFGLTIYNEDDTIPTKTIIQKRNFILMLFLGIDVLLLLTNKKFVADYICKTKVVKVRK